MQSTDMERFEVATAPGTLAGMVAGPRKAALLPIVLVHGINMSSDVWADVLPALGGDRRVVAFDLRGHGGSHRKGPFTAGEYAADTLAVMDHLGIGRAHVVGTSFGGAVACVLAARDPERVASMMAIGSALRVEGLDVQGAIAALRGVGVRPFFAAFLPQASFAPGTPDAIVARALDAAVNGRDVETVVAVSTAALTSDLTSEAGSVRRPALVVTGELDGTCPVTAGEAMARALRAEHRVIPGRGHVLSMEDPAAVAALVAAHAAAHEEAR